MGSAQEWETIQVGDRIVDLKTAEIRGPDGANALRPLELALVRYLAAREGRAVSRDQLLRDVWGYSGGVQSRTVDTTVKTLRRKLEAEPAKPRFLLCERGIGYRLRTRAVEAPDRGFATLAAESLIGREEDLTQLLGRLEGGVRLLTIAGAPGVGKSRVGSALARRLGERSIHVRLGDCGDEGVGVRIAAALGLCADDEAEIPCALAARGRPVLVLDDVEAHVIPLGPTLVSWLHEVPKLQIVTTSRERLQQGIEHLHLLRPLAVPEEDAAGLDELLASPASELFLRRARRVAPDFRPDGPDGSAIAAIVRKLDGLPLAIELAANRVHGLGPAALLTALERPFQVLEGAVAGLATGAWRRRLGPRGARCFAASAPSWPRSLCSRKHLRWRLPPRWPRRRPPGTLRGSCSR